MSYELKNRSKSKIKQDNIRLNKIILSSLIICSLLIILSSCQPMIRFSSNKSDKNSNSNNSNYTHKEKNKSDKSKTTEKNENSSSDYNLEDIEDLDETESQILSEAQTWLGVPYCYGGEDRNCTDCSGLIQQIYLNSTGKSLPRTADEQYEFSEKITQKELRPTDLIFFGKSGNISHVGMYCGNGYFIHASSSRGVIREILNEYTLGKPIVGGGRINLNPKIGSNK